MVSQKPVPEGSVCIWTSPRADWANSAQLPSANSPDTDSQNHRGWESPPRPLSPACPACPTLSPSPHTNLSSHISAGQRCIWVSQPFFPTVNLFPLLKETQLWLINLIIRLFPFFFFSGRPVLWCYFWATYASWRCFCQGFWEQVVNSTDRGEREINTGLCFVGTNIFSSPWPWPLWDRCHVSCPRLRSDITSSVSQCVLRWEPK